VLERLIDRSYRTRRALPLPRRKDLDGPSRHPGHPGAPARAAASALRDPPVRLQRTEWPSFRRSKRTPFSLRHSQSKNAFQRRRAQSTNQACFLLKCGMPLRATGRVAFRRPGRSHNFPFKYSSSNTQVPKLMRRRKGPAPESVGRTEGKCIKRNIAQRMIRRRGRKWLSVFRRATNRKLVARRIRPRRNDVRRTLSWQFRLGKGSTS